MNTPIFDFINKYNSDKFIRLHMPGHKGSGFCAEMDITEIVGADSLFAAKGIILESENNAASLFGTQKTLYSTQGSTLAIQTMLTLAASSERNSKPIFIALRNAHSAFINACVLLDAAVKWVYPNYHENSIASGEFSAAEIETAILESERKPCAVYVTSPDYLGKLADIKGISEVCKKHGVLLLVDNAHGAYLNFLVENRHPISLGCDMCCDSAHKTLPVLTGGAYLHISKSADKSFCENAKSAMALFSSTSPSYLTLASLDLCNKYLSESYRNELCDVISHISALKEKLAEKGYTLCGDEPLKIVINAVNSGYYGKQLAEILREKKIECEYSDETHIVLLFSSKNTSAEIELLGQVLLNIKLAEKIPLSSFVKFEKLPSGMAIREAALSASEEIPIENSLGRICSKPASACPPGIPVAVSGEVITENAINIFKRYSISSVNVVK